MILTFVVYRISSNSASNLSEIEPPAAELLKSNHFSCVFLGGGDFVRYSSHLQYIVWYQYHRRVHKNLMPGVLHRINIHSRLVLRRSVAICVCQLNMGLLEAYKLAKLNGNNIFYHLHYYIRCFLFSFFKSAEFILVDV